MKEFLFSPWGIILTFMILALLASMLWCYSTIPFYERDDHIKAETKMFGIIIRGHSVWGWIMNTNSFPVRIRSTWVFHGERDRWNEILMPGEKIDDVPGHQVLYHVYPLNSSEEIGVIWTTPNGPDGPLYRNPFFPILRKLGLSSK